MKKIVTVIAAFALLLLGTSFTAPANSAPADMTQQVQAKKKGVFNDLVHASDDSGYTAPIRIRCGDGRIRYLYVGEWSGPKCGFHVDRIIPEPNQMVVCHNMLPPYQSRTYWYQMTWDLPSWSSFKCYMQRPI